MKTTFGTQSPTKSIAVRLLLDAILIGAAIIPAAAGANDANPIAMDKVVVVEAKTHTLFMGADIAVNFDKDLYAVRGVIGPSWVIEINGQEKVVSAKEAPLDLKITPSLKLTDVSATIVGYKKERAYTFNNDPSVRLTRGLTAAGSMNADLLSMAGNGQHIADVVSNRAMGNAASAFAAADDPLASGPLAVYRTAEAIASARGTTVSQITATAAASQADNGDEPGARLVQTGFDGMDVEFEISSEKPLQKPYIVTITQFHPKGTKPGTVQNLVYARELHPIDGHPTNVHFVEGGFPYDFELIDFQLHIYNNRGEEVATTVSTKRVELTRDEAFEYVKIEYLGAHKGATLPAAAAMAILPADLPVRLAAGEFQETFFVRVSKDGLADEPFADATCTKRIEDPYLEKVVRSFRFNPALAQGSPVEGVASLNLRQLKI